MQVTLTDEELRTLKSLLPNVTEPSIKRIINIISQIKLKDEHLGEYLGVWGGVNTVLVFSIRELVVGI